MRKQILARARALFMSRSGTIRTKLVRIVLTNSLAALVILGGISFYGMYDALSTARDMGVSLGRESYRDSSDLLVRQKKQELIHIAEDNALDISHRIGDVARSVEAIAQEMGEIERSPGRFLPQQVSPPGELNYEDFPFYIQYAQGFSPQEFGREIAFAANIRDFLLRAVERSEMTDSMFIASRHHFALSVDDNRREKRAERTVPNLYYDAPAQDWYREAAQRDGTVFTDVRRYVFSKRLGLFCATPYHNAGGGLEGVAAAQVSLDLLSRILKEADLYDDGFCFVTDRRGFCILSSEDEAYNPDFSGELVINMKADLRESENTSLAETVKEMVAGKSGITEATVDGERYYIAYAPIKRTGWSFGTAIAASEVVAPAVENAENIQTITEEKVSALEGRIFRVMLLLAVFVAVLLVLVARRGRKLSEQFAEPIYELSDGVREIASGNMEKKLDIHTGDEIEHLAVCFNAMTDELQSYMRNLTKATAEKERIATELSVATNIQESMLPRVFPPFPGRGEFDIYATMHAAKEVGGDFYDFYLLDENHVVITIADVSGKGVPAALFMVVAKTILKNFALTMGGADDLAPLVACANDQLVENNDAMMFVTLFIGMLDVKTGKFFYVNAGHNPPLIYRAEERQFRYIGVKRNFVLGGMDGLSYEGEELDLAPGDLLFFYTDGVTEALNEDKELYGEERLLDALNHANAGEISLKELLASVRKSLDAHVKTAEQSDDITMLALSYRGLESDGQKGA